MNPKMLYSQLIIHHNNDSICERMNITLAFLFLLMLIIGIDVFWVRR